MRRKAIHDCCSVFLFMLLLTAELRGHRICFCAPGRN